MRIRECRAGALAMLGLVTFSLALTAAAAHAQDLPLAQVLPELILHRITLESGITPGLPAGELSHVAHFSPLEANDPDNPAVAIVQGFNSQLATQFSTFPLGSSTGGLTYVFDDSVGTFRRGSASFGPLFGERALTIGRGKLSAGFNYQRTSYDSFEGRNLDDGSIKFYLRHEDCCTLVQTPQSTLTNVPNGTRLNPPFEGDLIEAALSLEATTHTTAVFANYGVSDRWDVGLAVPFVKVKLDARVQARIIRLVTRTNMDVHTFEVGNPNAIRTVQHSGQTSGLGDIVLRSKYRFLRGAGGGLAAAIDLRLPTGSENELLGAGGTQTKLLLVASAERGRVGQHFNIGYTVAEGNVAGTSPGLTPASLPDEIDYSGGIEFVASPRLTLMGDVIGRTLRGAGRLRLASKSFEYNAAASLGPGPGCGGLAGFTCASASFEEFAPRPGHLTLLLGTAGAKVNLSGNLLISGSVLFPLTDAGLRSRVTTVVGLDYAF